MFFIGISGVFIPYFLFVGVLVVFSFRIAASPVGETEGVDEFLSSKISTVLCSSLSKSVETTYFCENFFEDERQTVVEGNKSSGVREELLLIVYFVDLSGSVARFTHSLSQIERFCFDGLSPPHIMWIKNHYV
jgi:hypothetical protein